jgi:4-hydroxy-3-methylbut-2-enyl diphosphate reductase
MQIKTIKNYGFCNGVKRSIDIVYKLLNEKKKVYSLGDIIHNPQQMRLLKMQGLVVVNSIDDIPQGSYLILRSHGVPPELERKARLKNLKPIDTTCPNVKKVQNLAKELLIIIILW